MDFLLIALTDNANGIEIKIAVIGNHLTTHQDARYDCQ